MTPRNDPIGEQLPAGVSVVVPCYRSEETLETLVDELLDVLPRCGERFELVLVDDHSPDGTWRTISRLADRHSAVRGFRLMRNFGQHNATLCGLRKARYRVTVTLDDDLQHPPSQMPTLLDKLAEGHDLVYGMPLKRPQSLFRNTCSVLIRYATKLATGRKEFVEMSAFRALQTRLRDGFASYASPQVMLDVLFGWATTNVTSVRVQHDRRREGRSNWGFWQQVNAVLLLWTGYTTVPLRLATLIGFFFVLFGLGILTYVVGVYFLQGSIPGFSFLASTIAIFGGVQLFALGIIGEYLGRIFQRSLDRPPYVVADAVGRAAGAEPPPLPARSDPAPGE